MSGFLSVIEGMLVLSTMPNSTNAFFVESIEIIGQVDQFPHGVGLT